jgi:hypothetical protein
VVEVELRVFAQAYLPESHRHSALGTRQYGAHNEHLALTPSGNGRNLFRRRRPEALV